MTQSNDRKISKNRYPDEFRENALALAQRIAVAKAARELNLHESPLYAWRRRCGQKTPSQQLQSETSAQHSGL